MSSFNKVLLLGNLTRDPQLSYLPSQTAVVDFGMAMNRKWKDQNGKENEEVCFVDVKAFGKPAETLNKYCKKGNLLLVEGRLSFEQWTDKEGGKHSRLRVLVENFQLMPNGDKASNGQSEQPQAPQQPQGGYQQPQSGYQQPQDTDPF